MFNKKTAPSNLPLALPPDQDEFQLLAEKDFINLISLEERYNYYKNLINIQTINNMNQTKSQQSLVKIMLKMIEYYAECISQTQANIENIVKYFQHKMKEVNLQYKKIVQKGKEKEKGGNREEEKKKVQLGLFGSEGGFKLPDQFREEEEQQEQVSYNSSYRISRASMSRSVMIALQSQNIKAHIEETNKNAEFVKKSIVNSIQTQQEDLNRRRMESKKKREDSQGKKKGLKSSLILSRPQTQSGKVFASFNSASTQLEDESQYFQSLVLQKLQDTDIRLKPLSKMEHKL